MPMLHLTGGLATPSYANLPARADLGPTWFGDLGASLLPGLVRAKISLDFRLSSFADADFKAGVQNERHTAFSLLWQLGYWFPTERRP